MTRATTFGSVMSGFNAGIIAGPAIGGALAAAVGPAYTCWGVGGGIVAAALLAHRLVPETRGIHELGESNPPQTQSASDVVRELRASWKSSPELRRLCAANYAFLATIAGANMTVLPLVLSGDMGLSPGAVGSLFAVQAAVSLAATIPVAKLADAWGPSTVIPPAMLVTAAAFATLPWADHLGYEYVACTMAVQGLGTCVLGSAPTAAAANAVPEEDRSGALALLRVGGDLGMLTGSAAFGALAASAGSDAAFGAAAALLVGTAAGFRLAAPGK